MPKPRASFASFSLRSGSAHRVTEIPVKEVEVETHVGMCARLSIAAQQHQAPPIYSLQSLCG